MTRRLRLRSSAEEDLRDAARWYEEQGHGLGDKFLDEAQRTLGLIEENPLLYPVIYRRLRRVLLRRFPFGIYYRMDGDIIRVFAIIHGHRHPRHWKQRG